MDTVLNKDREAIQRDVMRSTQAQLDRYHAGVLIRNVNIQNVQPPAAVQAAFDDALKAGQDRDRLKNQGQAYANRVVAEAKGQAARMGEEAEGYKARVLGQAQGDAQRFDQIVAQYQKAPQVTRDRLYTDAMQELYGKTTKVLVDSKGNNIINLPLDKLQGGKAAEAAASTATPAAAQAAAAAQSTPGTQAVQNPAATSSAAPAPRGRDELRSRSRESR
jgi:membrane protease subunit HflK